MAGQWADMVEGRGQRSGVRIRGQTGTERKVAAIFDQREPLIAADR